MAKWTTEENAQLAGMKRAKLSNKVIAARLGRSVAAVAKQAGKLKAYRNLNHSVCHHTIDSTKPNSPFDFQELTNG